MSRRPISPIEDLNWFFKESPAALGMKAQAISDTSAIPSASSDFAPTDNQMHDANRQRRIQRELSQLSTEHKAVLEVAYEQRKEFTIKGGTDAETKASEMTREDRSRYDLAAPVERKVRMEYQAASERADKMVRAWERDERQALKDGDADEIEWTKGQLSAARTLRREVNDRARKAEGEGVELLREAHKAYRTVRTAMRRERKEADKRERALANERREERRQRGVEAQRALRSAFAGERGGDPLPDSHAEELRDICDVLGPLLTKGYSDETAAWLESGGLA